MLVGLKTAMNKKIMISELGKIDEDVKGWKTD